MFVGVVRNALALVVKRSVGGRVPASRPKRGGSRAKAGVLRPLCRRGNVRVATRGLIGTLPRTPPTPTSAI